MGSEKSWENATTSEKLVFLAHLASALRQLSIIGVVHEDLFSNVIVSRDKHTSSLIPILIDFETTRVRYPPFNENPEKRHRLSCHTDKDAFFNITGHINIPDPFNSCIKEILNNEDDPWKSLLEYFKTLRAWLF